MIWNFENFSGRDATQNYVEKTGIEAFSTWTLSPPSAPLPVIFSAFNLQCNSGKVILSWKTAQEFNSSHFIIEKNTGSQWTSIGQVPAAGNSSTEKSYEFIDNNPLERDQYRLAQYDIDGRVKYTSVLVADCAITDALLAWPNPFIQAFTMRINTNRSGKATLHLVDAKGSLVMNRQQTLQSGINQFEVDLKQVAKGVYLLTVEWGDGQYRKSMRLVKQ